MVVVFYNKPQVESTKNNGRGKNVKPYIAMSYAKCSAVNIEKINFKNKCSF